MLLNISALKNHYVAPIFKPFCRTVEIIISFLTATQFQNPPLLSREEFGPSYNAGTGQHEGGLLSFPDFIELVVNGAKQLAEFTMENGDGSMGFDTGVIDGEGQSKAWNSYWKECGICHKDYQPDYILHMETFEDDIRVRGRQWGLVIS